MLILNKDNGKDELTKVFFKCIWKCYNWAPVQLLYANKNVFKMLDCGHIV
jgi:hypothetical protein